MNNARNRRFQTGRGSGLFYNLTFYRRSLVRFVHHNRLLPAGLAILLRSMDRMNASRAINAPLMQRIDRRLQIVFDATGLTTLLSRIKLYVHAIVAQGNQPLKSWNEAPPGLGWADEVVTVSPATRLSVTCLSLLVLTWSGMSLFSSLAVASETNTQTTDAVPLTSATKPTAAAQSLAVVNPANLADVDGVSAQRTDASLHQPRAVIAPPSAMRANAAAPAVINVATVAARASATRPALESANAITSNGGQGPATGTAPVASPAAGGLAVLAPTATPTVSPTPTHTPSFTPSPTATPTDTPTPTTTPTEALPDVVPQVRIIGPSLLLPSPSPTPTPTDTATPTPTPLPLEPGRLWSTFVPGPPAQSDHFWIARPFPSYAKNQLASTSYQFGSTASARYRIHHGIDISNPTGTPILAGAVGEVVHAGRDNEMLLGPYTDFYGNAVVIRLDQRLSLSGGELDVYVLYGHMSEVRVTVGQRVNPGDIVGLVGMTGIAIGPHLHVEVRLGANTYDHSVNPYLWLQPTDGTGAVAVRLLTADGRTWPRGRVSLARFGANGTAVWARQIEIYPDSENIGPDPVWGENGALGSVPAGNYVVLSTVNGERLRQSITVRAGETTFVELRTEK